MVYAAFLTVSLLLMGTASAVEVATIDSPKKYEFVLVMTESGLSDLLEKQTLAQVCRPRLSINGNLKEFTFQASCSAEIIRFLLNAQYKPDQHFRTFTK